jgi:hypothetical protein
MLPMSSVAEHEGQDVRRTPDNLARRTGFLRV